MEFAKQKRLRGYLVPGSFYNFCDGRNVGNGMISAHYITRLYNVIHFAPEVTDFVLINCQVNWGLMTYCRPIGCKWVTISHDSIHPEKTSFLEKNRSWLISWVEMAFVTNKVTHLSPTPYGWKTDLSRRTHALKWERWKRREEGWMGDTVSSSLSSPSLALSTIFLV